MTQPTEKDPTKPHYRVLVISQELFKVTSNFFLQRNDLYHKWTIQYWPKHRTESTHQRNYFIEIKKN